MRSVAQRQALSNHFAEQVNDSATAWKIMACWAGVPLGDAPIHHYRTMAIFVAVTKGWRRASSTFSKIAVMAARQDDQLEDAHVGNQPPLVRAMATFASLRSCYSRFVVPSAASPYRGVMTDQSSLIWCIFKRTSACLFDRLRRRNKLAAGAIRAR